MKLTVILKRGDYKKLSSGDCDFLSSHIYISSRISVKAMYEHGNVNDDEVAMQVTVDKSYSIEMTSRLKEVEE